MKRIFGISVLMSLLAVSCQEDMNDQVQTSQKERDLVYMEFTTGAPQLKTMLDKETNDVLWLRDDAISIFTAGVANTTGGDKFLTKDDEVPVATFAGETELAKNYYALYPYSNTASVTEDGKITINFPKTKWGTPDTFADGYNYSVGVADADGNLSLKNIAALIKVTIPEDMTDLKELMVQGYNGENMAGEVKVDALTGEVVEVISKGDAAILQVKGADGKMTVFTPGATYYLPTLPLTFERGLKLKLTYKDGSSTYMFKGFPDTFTLERNKVLNLKKIGRYETFMMYDFEDGEKPAGVTGNAGSSLEESSVLTVVRNEDPDEVNPSEYVFKDDMGKRADATSGYVKFDLTSPAAKSRFPYPARQLFTKIRIKVHMRNNDYCPHMRLHMSDGGTFTCKPAVVNGTTLENGTDGKRVWNAALINKGEWNVLEYHMSDFTSGYSGNFGSLNHVEFRPMCKEDGNDYPGALNDTNNTRILCFDDIEFLR